MSLAETYAEIRAWVAEQPEGDLRSALQEFAVDNARLRRLLRAWGDTFGERIALIEWYKTNTPAGAGIVVCCPGGESAIIAALDPIMRQFGVVMSGFTRTRGCVPEGDDLVPYLCSVGAEQPVEVRAPDRFTAAAQYAERVVDGGSVVVTVVEPDGARWRIPASWGIRLGMGEPVAP
jgi:hypothetical protein